MLRYPGNLCQAAGVMWFKFLLYILILSVSIAVVQEYVASNDTGNAIDL